MSLLYTFQDWETVIIDLTKPLDVIYNGIKKETRKNIRKLEETKKSLCVDCDELYYSELVKARRKQGLKTSSYLSFKRLLQNPKYWNFVVIKDNVVLGGIGLIESEKGVVKEQGLFRTEFDDVNCQDYLKWVLIKFGKGEGYSSFDLAGIHPNPPVDSKEALIRKYKLKFGGEIKQIKVQRNRLGLLRDKLFK